MNAMVLSVDGLLDNVQRNGGSAGVSLVKKAYEFARQAHEGQKRMSGEPFIIHPVEVAKIVTELKLDPQTVSAALLHDVVEDCAVTLDEIRKNFGDEIAALVDGVTKLSFISMKQEKSDSRARLAREEEHFENLRRIFVAMAKDIRVIIIKLADRLHNLRTLCNLSRDRQRFVARETLEIFAPLAHRLGIWQVKGELEDLAFSYSDPENFQELSRQVGAFRQALEKDIAAVIEILSQRLEASGIHAQIEGRPKHLYSIWQKMKKKGTGFESVHDLTAVRVLVNTVEDCYATLGIAHSLWMPLHDRIKDYIAKPKANNYQSLHTTVYGPGGAPLEIQIRTHEMHRVAEYGVAAHWHYKQTAKDKGFEKLLAPWVSQLREWQSDLKSAKEYVQAFKMDFLEKQVLVFTPKGDVFDLPAGSVPADFAYRVHTDVGHHCTGAKVNGRMVPLDTRLANGDIVEIVTNKNSPGPSRDWLNLCKTSSAKNKIRLWFKKEKREENVLRGKEILEKFIRKLRDENLFPDQKKETFAEELARKANFTRFVDFLEAVGYGEVSLQSLFLKLKEDLEAKAGAKKPAAPPRASRRTAKNFTPVLVKGVEGALVRLSRCCNPVPGDKITGYVTLGKGISVHQESCSNMRALGSGSRERISEVVWNPGAEEGVYLAEIEVQAWDKPGLLGEVLDKVYAENILARSCQASAKGAQAAIRIALEIPNVNRLGKLLKEIGNLPEVIEVRRLERG